VRNAGKPGCASNRPARRAGNVVRTFGADRFDVTLADLFDYDHITSQVIGGHRP